MTAFPRLFCRLFALSILAVAGAGTSAISQESIKVVYHLNEGVQQAASALCNIRLHLNADPQARIVVVTHGSGIDFLLKGARDAQGNSFEDSIGELAAKGVLFRVCNNTLVARKIDKIKVVLEADVVDSGVAEVARLQAQKGHVYLRP